MKFIIDETPTGELHGRCLNIATFVQEEDICDKRVLDIGCGYGWFELDAINRGAARIIAIEPVRETLLKAKDFVRSSRVEFQLGSATDLPFPDRSFDTVVCWDVIEHLKKRTENTFFQEVGRVLGVGGVFYLSTPYRSLRWLALDPTIITGHRHYTTRQLSDFAAQNNFEVEKIAVQGGWWEILSAWTFYISKWVFRRQQLFEGFFNRRQDEERSREGGFVDLLCRCTRR